MNPLHCDRVTFAQLVDYAAGGLTAPEAEALEAHLFSCADCGAHTAELDALLGGIRAALRSAEVGGFLTDEVLNRLARDGVRVRTFTLSPGAVVPCAVWEDDELMALRLRGDFGQAREVTLSQRIAGTEVIHITAEVPPSAHGELIHVVPAAWVRQLPAVEVQVLLSADEGEGQRPIGSYTLVHGGSLHRR